MSLRDALRRSGVGFSALGTVLAAVAPAFADTSPGPAVPEPASYLVFLAGALGVAWVVRRRS